MSEENEHQKRAKEMLKKASDAQAKAKLEQEMWNKKLEAIKQRDLDCDHLENPVYGSQQAFKDDAKGVYVLITTVMCSKCGHLFFDQQDTGIKATTLFLDPKQKKGEEESAKN